MHFSGDVFSQLATRLASRKHRASFSDGKTLHDGDIDEGFI
jgi:hypothetical protein